MFEYLEKFLLQSKTDNLKTLEYPKEYLGLRMKTSFGQGVPARVSWISFFAPEMTTSNGFYPVYLYYKDKNILILSYGISETSEHPQSWPDEIDSSKEKIIDFLPDAPRYGSSYIHSYYYIESDSIYKTSEKSEKLTHEKLSNDLNGIIEYYKKSCDIEIKNPDSYTSSSQFHIEEELENFIIHNWNNIELSKKYELIFEDGELKSKQYKVNFNSGINRIDILVKDKKNKNHVVIELKKGQTSDETVGQVLRYMGWVKANLKDDNVKGIIIASSFDDKLKAALSIVNDEKEKVEVFVYNVDFKLNPHE